MRPLARFAPILAFAFTLSCADMPTAPRPIVTVTGQITDRDGPGIEQVYVAFYSLDPRDERPDDGYSYPGQPPNVTPVTTVTDGQGRYQLTIAAGRYLVYLSPAGYPEAQLGPVRIEAGSQVNYRYTGVRVTGTFTDPEGMALTIGRIYALAGAPGLPSFLTHPVAGRYSILVPPGVYELMGVASGNTGIPYFRTPPVALMADTTIDMQLDGMKVTGTVRGQNGVPLNRILVEANSGDDIPVRSFTGSDGTYTMYLRPGAYAFHLDAWDYDWMIERDYPPVSVTGPTSLDFDMSGVEWTGTVRRSVDSTTVAGAQIVAREITQRYRTAWSATDANGGFHFLVRPNWYYRVMVYLPSDSVAEVVSVGDFATTADSTFTFYVDAPPLP